MCGLKSFLIFNNLNQVDVAQYLSVSKGQMSKLVSGTSRLQPEQLEKLLHNDKGWNTEFLTDPIWKDFEAGKYAKPPQRDYYSKGIPMIPLEAFASPGLPNYDDIRVLNYYMVDEFKGCDFVIRIKGDSMSPRYASGDVVACKKILEMLYFQWGRVYVLYTQSNGIMIKRLQPSDKEDCVRCVSDNDKYAPFDVPKSDIVSLALVNGLVSLE